MVLPEKSTIILKLKYSLLRNTYDSLHELQSKHISERIS